MLTENDIKKFFPIFLRSFYLHRYDHIPGTEEVLLDNVSEDGLVADGLFSFATSEGGTFVCAFEATSANKAEEVKYRLNTIYFFWDCLAFSGLTAAVAYAIAYSTRFAWLFHLGWEGNLGYLLGFGLIGFLGWYFLMRGWKKYRYIYAIEQFKQYQADEQWIALGEDVFPSPADPYLQELRNQCIYHGFGLALVSPTGQVRPLVTPSRLGIYGKDRRIVHWITRREWYQALTHDIKVLAKHRPRLPTPFARLWNKLTRPIQYLVLGKIGHTVQQTATDSRQAIEAAWGRYMSAQAVQKWLFIFSLIFIAFFAHRVFTYHEASIEELVERSSGYLESQYNYLYEEEYSSGYQGLAKQYPGEPLDQSSSPVSVVSPRPSRDARNEQIPEIDLSGSGIEGERESARQSCAPYENIRGWIIIDEYFTRQDLANKRAEELKGLGIEVTVVPEECLSLGRGYIVMLGKANIRRENAESQRRMFMRQMEDQGFGGHKLTLLEITR